MTVVYHGGIPCPRNERPGETDIAHIRKMIASVPKECFQESGLLDPQTVPLGEVEQLLSVHKKNVIEKVTESAESIIKSLTDNPPSWHPSTLRLRIWFDSRTDLMAFKDLENTLERLKETRFKEGPLITLYTAVESPQELKASCAKIKKLGLEKLQQALEDFVPPSRVVTEWALKEEGGSSRSRVGSSAHFLGLTQWIKKKN